MRLTAAQMAGRLPRCEPLDCAMDPTTPSQGPTPTLVTPQVVPEATSAAPQRRSGARVVFWLLLFGIAGIGLIAFGVYRSGFNLAGGGAGLREKHHSLARFGRDKVAIIKLEGAILKGEGFVKQQIDQIRDDDAVKAVVLRVDSPGGTVTGSDYIYHHLTELVADREIPLVVSMGSIAASGGYYVAMAVGDTPDSIFAEPTTWTGSIGVIIPHYNVAGLFEEWSIEEDSVKSHPLKSMGSFAKKMTDEERAIFQALVDDSFEGFKEIVRSGRPRFRDAPEELDKVATGQVFTANQAVENGLVDQQGFIEAAIDRAIELAELDKENVRVVTYQRQMGVLEELLLGPQVQRRRQLDLAALFDLTTPRAYYLFTWPPPLEAYGVR